MGLEVELCQVNNNDDGGGSGSGNDNTDTEICVHASTQGAAIWLVKHIT